MNSPIPARRLPIIPLGLLGIIAVWTRCYHLGHFSFWLDETVQYNFSINPLWRLQRDAPPEWLFLPLVITKCQILLGLDNAEWQLRLPWALFGALTVIAVWALTRELFGRDVAWIAAILSLFWVRLIEYSQEMRPYSLLAFAAAVSAWSLLTALRTREKRYWAVYAASSIVALYAHFIAIFQFFSTMLFLLILFAWHAFARRDQRVNSALSRNDFILAFGAIAVVGAALLPIAKYYWMLATSGSVSRVGRLPISSEVLHTLFGSFLGLGEGSRLAINIAALVIGAVYAILKSRRGFLLLALWVLVPIALALFTGGGAMLRLSPRYLQFAVPALLPLIAAGIFFSIMWVATKALSEANSYGNTAPNIFVAIAGTVVLLANGPAWMSAYWINRKTIPIDLRSGYNYMLHHVHYDDIIVGIGEPGFWPSGWFHYTDSYYLRPAATNYPRKVIAIGSDPNRGDAPFHQINSARGKLYALIATPAEMQSRIVRAADSNFVVHCWSEICVAESVAGPAGEQLDAFAQTFQFIDPAALRRLPHDRAEAGSTAHADSL